MSFLKRFLFYVLAIIVVIAVFFTLGEIGINCYYSFPQAKRPLFIPHPFLGCLHPRHTHLTYTFDESEKIRIPHQTNSWGLMGKEFARVKDPGTFRILVMGDSFTEALQVPDDQNYCVLLEKQLNQRFASTGKRIEVINAGISGFSPISYYLLYKKMLAGFNSDLVIVQLFANDVYEDNKLTATSFLDDQGYPARIRSYFTKPSTGLSKAVVVTNADNPLFDYLLTNSRWMEFLYTKYCQVRKKSKYNKEMMDKEEYFIGHQFFILYNKGGFAEEKTFRERVAGLSEKYLLGLKDLVEHNGAKFLAFYIPMEGQLKRDQYSDHVRVYTDRQMGHYWNDRLEELTRTKGLRFFDLLPILQTHSEEGLYFNQDGHLTVKGQALVADSLSQYLDEQKIISDRSY